MVPDPFDDATVARAIAATRRKKLIFAGVSLEVCAAFPAITAVGKGLDAYVAVDASGTFSETKRHTGLPRMLQAGVIVSDYASLMVEILADNARPEAEAMYGAIDMAWAKLVGQIARLTARSVAKALPGLAVPTSDEAARRLAASSTMPADTERAH